ncbi:arginase [Propioniciclava flava]|uniref:Arginase n=1 Tax=Propioniciclava flava TaxID=2072026 RepID=A0A4Q2EJ68_9ACTN|nr:arginase [Propioniciclava flava]RXW33581.1 arginase [Propioniciclava flava]
MDLSLIGAPTDVGASVPGCRLGPGGLRIAGIGTALAALGHDVEDVGDLVGPPNPRLSPVDGYRHLPEVTAWNIAVRDAVADALHRGRLPILLGGDHSLAVGSISAVARHCRAEGRRLLVVWVDAHADINTATMTPSGNIHGMPVACLLGFGPEILTGLSGQVPALTPADVHQVGLRRVDAGEKRFLVEQGLSVYDMRFIDEVGMREALRRALADVDENTHVHLSLDVDFVDPAVAPGVGTPVVGGPTYREAQLCMEMIADTGRLRSLDVVEVNPALDVRNTTSTLAVDLVESLFGKSTLLRMTPHPSAT